MSIRRPILRALVLIGLFCFQVVVWQVALVHMAHVHSEMHYPTAVDLLENRPLSFYAIVAVPLLLSNVVLMLWCRRGVPQAR